MIMLTPTMPPSKMVAGTKNSSSAKAANTAPAVRKRKLAKNCRKVENFVLFMIRNPLVSKLACGRDRGSPLGAPDAQHVPNGGELFRDHIQLLAISDADEDGDDGKPVRCALGGDGVHSDFSR